MACTHSPPLVDVDGRQQKPVLLDEKEKDADVAGLDLLIVLLLFAHWMRQGESHASNVSYVHTSPDFFSWQILGAMKQLQS